MVCGSPRDTHICPDRSITGGTRDTTVRTKILFALFGLGATTHKQFRAGGSTRFPLIPDHMQYVPGQDTELQTLGALNLAPCPKNILYRFNI